MARGIYIGTENFISHSLPSGYTQVEYIQSSGTQYINTGVQIDSDGKIDMDVEIPTEPAAQLFVFGVSVTGDNERYGVTYLPGDKYWRNVHSTGDGSEANFPTTLKAVGRHRIVKDGNQCTIDGITMSTTQRTFTSSRYVFLFARNQEGSPIHIASARLYSCKMYRKGALVRDFVPCKNASGTVGLYDLVGKKFYTNAGTGVFIAGENHKANIASKVRKVYVGVTTEVPIIEQQERNVYINSKNLETYFTVGKMDYPSGNTQWTVDDTADGKAKFVPSNFGKNNSSSTLLLRAKVALSNVEIRGEYYTESGYDKIFFLINGVYQLQGESGSSAEASRWKGNLAIGDQIELEYKKDNNNSATNEINTNFYIVAQVKETVDVVVGHETKDVARKVKKAYIGIGGKARPCFSLAQTLSYYGEVHGIAGNAASLAAASLGDHAFFAGGTDGTAKYHVTVYDMSLTYSTAINLLANRSNLAATSVGNYAVFAGGFRLSDTDTVRTVDAYERNGTHVSPPALSWKRGNLAATSVGNTAIFAGGITDSSSVKSEIDFYDKSLSKYTAAKDLKAGRQELAATTVGDYALFGGGRESYKTEGRWISKALDAFNESLTAISAADLDFPATCLAAATVGDYAIFFSGRAYYGTGSSDYQTAVRVYDKSLTARSLDAVGGDRKRERMAAATIGDYALFAGGCANGTTYRYVEVFDKSLTRTIGTDLTTRRFNLAAATVGDYALFGGGYNGDNYLNSVEAFTLV